MWNKCALAIVFLVSTAYAEDSLRVDVETLADKKLDGRAPGTEGDKTTRAYIVDRFKALKLAPAFGDSYEQPFKTKDATTANVAAVIRGSDANVGDEIILVSSHHDHLGDGHLGANDNASGVAAMLGIAKSLADTKPRRTIVFVAFGSEETGMNGSYFYAAHAPDDLPTDKIVQVINLDMVGTHKEAGFVAAMGTFPKLAATPVLAKLEKSYPKLNVGMGGKARGSDFEPFCTQGTPYVFFWTPDKRCYHERCDTPDKVDYAGMADITALAGDLTTAMADSTADLAAAKAKYGCFGKATRH
ncbi:MAG TPA: M20/M25/M40 family metallo-hydrolase [Kofleriaceae bacterium]